MKRKQICDILGISKSLLSLVLSGQRKSSLESKIRFLLKFEDTFETVLRQDAFGDFCELVIKKARLKDQFKEAELALNGKNLRAYIMNKYDENDVEFSIMNVFDKETFTDKKMLEFMNDKSLGSMCDIAMNHTKKKEIRKICTTIRLIQNEFWKPNLKN